MAGKKVTKEKKAEIGFPILFRERILEAQVYGPGFPMCRNLEDVANLDDGANNYLTVIKVEPGKKLIRAIRRINWITREELYILIAEVAQESFRAGMKYVRGKRKKKG